MTIKQSLTNRQDDVTFSGVFMQAYNIDRDLTDQRGNYLKGILIASVFLGITLAGLAIATSATDITPWLSLAITLAVANEFRRRKYVVTGAWVFLIGLLATLSLSLYRNGPNTGVYFLMAFPAALGALLLDRRSFLRLAIGACLLMFAVTALQSNVITAVSQTMLPSLFCLG